MSRLPFELLLALRYLRPKRTFVSVITLISIFGVTLGVAVLIIVISVMTGFDHELRDKILGFNAHLRIYAVDTGTGKAKMLTDYAVVRNVVNSNQNVVSSAPLAIGPVMVQTERSSGEQSVATPYLRGVEADSTNELSLVSTHIIEGTNDLSGSGLLLGIDLAENLAVRVGERVAIWSPEDMQVMMKSTTTNGTQEVVPPRDFVVRGIFRTGYSEYDSTIAICSLENFQILYGWDDDVRGLFVMLKDPYQADMARSQLERALGGSYLIRTWLEESSTMMAVIVEKNVMLYILFFIVIVAAFGITCTLITFVVLKTREIGVLKALGASGRQIMWIFLSQSMVVSTFGVLAGLASGMLMVAYRNPFLHLMRRLTKWELFPSSVYGFNELPALIVPGDILIICGGSFVICLLAAAFPAWHASRLRPVEALRHG